MKRIIPLLLMLFALAGCTQPVQDGLIEELSDDDHLGCQEGEIVDGKCIISEENNVQLFGQDLSSVQTQTVNDPLGFYAYPADNGTYPGVVMIHEWWGLNDNIKEMAQILAKEGYHVFAVDLYNGTVATNSSVAGALAGGVRNNPEVAIAHMRAATQFLKDRGATSLASLGWCFGGQQSLQLSLNEKLDATVIYYGNLVTNTTQLESLGGPVLGIFGSEDQGIPTEDVRAFESALNSINHPNSITIYEGVGHAFANPTGARYAENETLDAWATTVAFLEENLE